MSSCFTLRSSVDNTLMKLEDLGNNDNTSCLKLKKSNMRSNIQLFIYLSEGFNSQQNYTLKLYCQAEIIRHKDQPYNRHNNRRFMMAFFIPWSNLLKNKPHDCCWK